jgi:hypothetical protein
MKNIEKERKRIFFVEPTKDNVIRPYNKIFTIFQFLSILHYFQLFIPIVVLGVVAPKRGEAQAVVRIRSSSRIELRSRETLKAFAIAGVLEDSLGIPLPNERIEIQVLPLKSVPRNSRIILTTESDGSFATNLDRTDGADRVQARFDGSNFYEPTKITIDSIQNNLSAPLQQRHRAIAVENRKTDPFTPQPKPDETPSSFWLLIPMTLCSALIFSIRRREKNQRLISKITGKTFPHAGVETSRPLGSARAIQTEISGTVRDLTNGEGIPSAELDLIYEREKSIRLGVTSDGSFSARALASGKWLLRARARGYVETEKEFQIPHRGEWSGVQVRLQSMRSLALQPYKPVAFAVLPTPVLWDIWTLREILDFSRNKSKSNALFRSLTELVERAFYGPTPPSQEGIKTIEEQSFTALKELSKGETNHTVPHRR